MSCLVDRVRIVAPIIFEKKIGNNRTDGQIRIKTTTAPQVQQQPSTVVQPSAPPIEQMMQNLPLPPTTPLPPPQRARGRRNALVPG
jgi:hypothetical protein